MEHAFHNVADYKAAAKEVMPSNAWHYVACGADDEITRDENSLAYHKFKFLPRILDHAYMPDLNTTLLGTDVSSPVILAPVSPLTLIESTGELAQAQAGASADVLAAISTDCHYPMEQVAKHSKKLWFQLYCYSDRSFLKHLIQRAEDAGYLALVVTVDCTILGNRERLRRNAFAMPDSVQMGNLGVLERETDGPLISGSIPRVKLTWDDISWIKSVTKLPLIVKGVLNPADAKRAEEAGASAVVLSNHGGRQLDHAIPPLLVLEETRAKLKSDTEIYIDGGISRGTDIVKAMCLGANAILLGRAYIWGLAVNGKEGILDVLAILEHEMKSTLIQLGVNDIAELSPECIRSI